MACIPNGIFGKIIQMMTHRALCGLSQTGMILLSLAVLGGASGTHAQSPASNIIRIVVPAGAGAPPDVLSRIIASELSETEGWRVTVENRPGALETLALADVLRQPADGRSLYAMSLPTIAVPALLPAMAFRPETD